MKVNVFLIIFIILSVNAGASWQTYQNDLRNTGIANGIGYFPLATANLSSDIGMDFQPLVGDADDDGKNEVIIFSNGSLIVLNRQLSIINLTKTGQILGQPALFDFDNDGMAEIIFNSRVKFTDYFFAYQLNNSRLQQEFNITLNNEANFSGIKCLNMNGTNACVFKDRRNYVHIINMGSKSGASYSISSSNETRQTVPAVGDIDNDGNYDAVFWLNEDGGNGYGLVVFDLGRKAVKWSVDNIFSPLILGPSEFHQLFRLKGQPVLADINKDNKLEIAVSAFYDDSNDYSSTSDWFTELFVYDANGTKLFSKCEINTMLNSGCNDGDNQVNKWEGTNPFVLDYDRNGIDDICFIKDAKRSGSGKSGFLHMALSCYNYSGDEIARVNLSNSEDGIKGTAMAADMNNDGEREIITVNGIYLLNGTVLFDAPSLHSVHPIAVDLDGNKALDLVWAYGNQTKAFLDNSSYKADLAVEEKDILFATPNGTTPLVKVNIRNNGALNLDNVKIRLTNAETMEEANGTISIRVNSNNSFTAALKLKNHDRVMAQVNYDDSIEESDDKNNFAEKIFEGLPYVYVSADLEPFNINSEFKDYIKNKLTLGYYTENENSADIKVYIGKNNPTNIINNVRTLDEFEFGYDYGNVIYYYSTGTMPYSSLVGAFKDTNGKIIVMIAGNEVEGYIAGTKEFIKNQPLFLSTQDKNSVLIDDENADAVKVFDYLHNGVNNEHYMQQTEQFRDIVKRALNDSMFTITEYNVTTPNSIVLRLRNIKTDLSSNYLLYLNSSQDVFMPVVMAGGIWSDITAWQKLGGELSSNGRDVWLIEITGGPNTECESCINYNYSHLVDEFWPALIGAVQGYTNKNKIQYVGHSNGCRTALDSLTNWSSSGKNNVGIIVKDGSNISVSLSSNPVDTFVAVGCPGNFSELSYFAKQVKSSGDVAIRRLQDKNKLHVNIGDVSHEMESILGELIGISRFFEIPKISLNLFGQYYDWIKEDGDRQPGKNLQVNYFTLIYGKLGFFSIGNDDTIVSVADETDIFNNTQSNNKKLISVMTLHVGMAENKEVKKHVKQSLDKTIY